MIQLPPITMDEASDLWRRTDYGCFAVVECGNDINGADAAAFFLEGYEYARKQIAKMQNGRP